VIPDYTEDQLKTNVFTPNGDGKNDVFNTSQFQNLNGFHIEIYNRWGAKVFESSNATTEWDGKIANEPADEGVYYWIIRYQKTCDPLHAMHFTKGFVQLLR